MFTTKKMDKTLKGESAKLRALRSHVQTCFPCLRALVPACLVAYLPKCQCTLRVYVLTCQRALRAYVLTCQRVLGAYMLMYQRALRAFRAYVPTCSRAITTNNKNNCSICFPYIFLIVLCFFFLWNKMLYILTLFLPGGSL